jgi:hypothetical protein
VGVGVGLMAVGAALMAGGAGAGGAVRGGGARGGRGGAGGQYVWHSQWLTTGESPLSTSSAAQRGQTV